MRNSTWLSCYALLLAAATLASPTGASGGTGARETRPTRAGAQSDQPSPEIQPSPNFESFDVSDAKTGATARLAVRSYTKAGVDRPVIFAFNGGPGASSLWLNYGFLGPTRITLPEIGDRSTGLFGAVANRESPLDVADVVIIDPVDTGLSRSTGGDPNAFFGTMTDGAAVAAMIRQWLARHDRQGAKVYVVGESFGCQRAATVAHDLTTGAGPRIDLRGIVLISQALNMPEVAERRGTRNIVSYVAALPAIARLARYHQLKNDSGKPVTGTDETVGHFAATAYLVALFQGRNIPATRAQILARQLNDYTGIPATWFLKHGLAISRDDFQREALRDRGEQLSTYDARVAGPTGPEDPFDVIYETRFNDAALADLRGQAPAHALDNYRSSSMEAGRAWQFGNSPIGDRPFVTYIRDLLAERPGARLMIVGGLYDFATTKEITDYLLAQQDLDRNRIVTAFYPAGHMVYASEAGRLAFSRDLHRFLAPTPSQRP